MTRAKVCEHLNACVNEDGTAIDGGLAMGCDLEPCDECGALCPASTWTPERAYARVDEAHAEYVRLVNKTGEQVWKYRKWLERKEDPFEGLDVPFTDQ